ncbi:MAG: NAD(+)/NADH kinase [Ferrimicrobium sp.]|uniref:NAD(+)/NADH kinase n=1 Tax=Ferrimicrobium sp. TaxID=2926050 RepID=UPI002635932B|nr:NAD(+)/NADH kinase [Ferrimicrobium sp.]
MMTLGFVLHPAHAQSSSLFLEAKSYLATHGCESIQLLATDTAHLEVDRTEPEPWTTSEPRVDAVVSIGGDGTMLRAMACAHRQGVPALGINLGQLGYLTEVEPSEMIDALASIISGEFTVEERLALCAEFKVDEQLRQVISFNEVVVEREVSGHVIRGDVLLGGKLFLRYEADGLIIATPTGSTAYNLSARGPIIAPSLRAIILTPLSPHMLFDRSLVLDSDQRIDFHLARGPNASVMVDGQVVHSLAPLGAVSIYAHPAPVQLIRVVDVPFYDIVKRKFRLNHSESISDA